MNVLFLSNWFPYPPNNGSKLRIYNLLRGLARRHEVTLISFKDEHQGTTALELRDICKVIHAIPAREYNPRSRRAVAGFFSTKPRVLVDRFSPEMAARIEKEIVTNRYDLVIASQWYMAAYCEHFKNLPAIFEEVEIGLFENRNPGNATVTRWLRRKLMELKMEYYFRKLLFHFTACTVVSEKERNLLKSMVPGYESIEVIPNGVQLSDYAGIQAEPQPNSLIFTGSFTFSANYKAMCWFLSEIYPRIRAVVPEVCLTITGDHGGLPLPETKNVNLTGFVKDVRPLVASAWISLAPLLVGGGTRLKILEAMALRSPVVATTKGAEGLAVQNGENILIADKPADFADAVIRLLKEPGLRQRLVENAYRLVLEKYDWPVVAPRFLSLADKVADKVG